MTPAKYDTPHMRIFVLAAAVGLLLLWRVLVVGIEALIGRGDAIAPGLDRAPLDAQSLTAPWRERLARNPADGSAMRMLSLGLEREGKRKEADAAIRRAVRLTPADKKTLLDAANYFRRSGDTTQALLALRRLVNLYPTDGDLAWPIYTEALGSGAANEFFDSVSRDNPPWYPAFFRYACEHGVDTAGAQRMLITRVTARVVTNDERQCVVGRLQKEGRWTLAYEVWLNSLPPADRQPSSSLFNGGFELPVSSAGFDWIVPVQDGVTADAPPMAGATGKRGLQVAYAGKRYEGPPVFQYLVLAPGPYRFVFRGRADGVDSPLGLQWGLYCLSTAGREIGQLVRSDRFVGSSDWMDYRYDFIVPKDCPVQMLRLELANPRRETDTPGGVATRLRGTLFFDDFSVRTLTSEGRR
jgi:hypothetical protein